MLQAEVGSAKLTQASSYPSRGNIMWNFTLPSTEGKQISLYDYRGRCNLALLFAGDVDHIGEENILSTLAQHYAEIRDQDSEVLLVLACSRERAERTKHQAQLPFPVLADEDMQVYKSVGALDARAAPAAALYVTDRFLEVYAAWRTGEGDGLPSASEVVSWLAYIDSQCPECTQAEWPRDD
jgi:peroxiredoxin